MTDLVTAYVSSLGLTVLGEESESASLLVQAEVRAEEGDGAKGTERVVALDCGEWPLGIVGIDLSESDDVFADGGRICFRLSAHSGIDAHHLAYRFDWPREGGPHGDYMIIPGGLPSFVLANDRTVVPLPHRVAVANQATETSSLGLSRLTVSAAHEGARAIDLFTLVNPQENFASLGSIHGDLELRASLRVLTILSKAGVRQVLANLAVAYEAVVQVLGGRAQGELLLAAPDDLVHNKGVEYPAVLTVDADSLASDFNLTYELARQLVHLWFGGGCSVLGHQGREAMAAVGAAVALHASSIFASRPQLTAALNVLRDRSVPRSWYQTFRKSAAGGGDAAAELALRLFEQEAATPGALRRVLSRSWARAMLVAPFLEIIQADEGDKSR